MAMSKVLRSVTVLFFLTLPSFLWAQKSDSTLVEHRVEQGENLYRISLKYHTTIKKILYWNHLSPDSAIKINQVLKIWVPATTTVKPGEKEDKNNGNNNTGEGEKKPAAEKEATEKPTEIAKPTVIGTDTIKVSNKGNNDFEQQFDTLKKWLKPVLLYVQGQKEPPEVFSGTRIALKPEEFDSTGVLQLSGYVDVYSSWYSETQGYDQFVKFPTLEPFADQVGLNQIALSAKYTASKMRGVVTLHYGDMPESSWSAKYNLIQQANAGVKIVKNLWFDMGYFRTHIGLESVQANENINSTIAIPTFFEPYFLSGAKLTYSPAGHFTFQINSFSGFNSFVENNNRKTIGFSVLYESDRLSVAYNNILSDDSTLTHKTVKQRLYNNFQTVYKSQWFDLGFELNYGLQGNAGLANSENYSHMASSILAVKYKATDKFAVYSRGEYYNDPNGILCGMYFSPATKLRSGLQLWGVSMGLEVKPITNSFVRLEGRIIQSFKDGQDIFYSNNRFVPNREELVLAVGCWF
ncbi:outer membrane beta-barrel protein [bacterium]|nr:outer membrane beta-barrel protein [bacterium]